MQRPKKGYILTLNKWNHLCIFRTLSNPFSTRLTSRGSRNLPLHQILPREPLKPLCSLNDYVIPPSPFAIPRETHRSAIPDPRNHALLPPLLPSSVARRGARSAGRREGASAPRWPAPQMCAVPSPLVTYSTILSLFPSTPFLRAK